MDIDVRKNCITNLNLCCSPGQYYDEALDHCLDCASGCPPEKHHTPECKGNCANYTTRLLQNGITLDSLEEAQNRPSAITIIGAGIVLSIFICFIIAFGVWIKCIRNKSKSSTSLIHNQTDGKKNGSVEHSLPLIKEQRCLEFTACEQTFTNDSIIVPIQEITICTSEQKPANTRVPRDHGLSISTLSDSITELKRYAKDEDVIEKDVQNKQKPSCSIITKQAEHYNNEITCLNKEKNCANENECRVDIDTNKTLHSVTETLTTDRIQSTSHRELSNNACSDCEPDMRPYDSTVEHLSVKQEPEALNVQTKILAESEQYKKLNGLIEVRTNTSEETRSLLEETSLKTPYKSDLHLDTLTQTSHSSKGLNSYQLNETNTKPLPHKTQEFESHQSQRTKHKPSSCTIDRVNSHVKREDSPAISGIVPPAHQYSENRADVKAALETEAVLHWEDVDSESSMLPRLGDSTNVPIYNSIKKMRWVEGFQSEGDSITVYVDFNKVDRHLALAELVHVTGAQPTKFRVVNSIF